MYVDHSRDVGEYNPCFPRYEFDGRRRRQHWPGDGRVPGLLRGTARDRARRLPRGVLRLRAPAAQLRSRPGGQDGRALAPVPTADAAGHTPRRARRAHHRGQPDPLAGATRAATARWCAKRRCAPPWGTAPRSLRSPPAAHEHPTTVSRVLRAQVAERPDADYVVCDDARLTYADAERRSRVLARGLLAAGAGRGSRIGLLYPTGLDFVVAWLATARVGAIAVPISTFSTPIELRDLLARADVDLLLGVPAYRGNDYVARAARRVGRGRGARAPSPTVPFLRHVWLEEGFATLAALAVRVPDAVLDAAEDDVTPDDRMVIVHTSGSTSAPKGVLHQHGSLLGHLERLNRLRGLAPGVRLFSNSPMFWVGGLAYNIARRARRRCHPPVLGLARPGRDARLHRARTTRAHQRVRRVDRRTGRAPELPHAATSRRSVVGTSTRCSPTPSGPRTRSSGTTCSARPRPPACA